MPRSPRQDDSEDQLGQLKRLEQEMLDEVVSAASASKSSGWTVTTRDGSKTHNDGGNA
jgi:hypothetical protein|nr:hypothetical protein [Kofleriaceae bacterium]